VEAMVVDIKVAMVEVGTLEMVLGNARNNECVVRSRCHDVCR
jgi:hypothetical protein